MPIWSTSPKRWQSDISVAVSGITSERSARRCSRSQRRGTAHHDCTHPDQHAERGTGKMSITRLELGSIVATPGALKALGEAHQEAWTFLQRHADGDWGEIPFEDRE